MRVDFVGSEAIELHAYLQKLIDAWPQNPETWTPQQHRVARAFLTLESSLQRDDLLLSGGSSY